jgi:hypothetical protein
LRKGIKNKRMNNTTNDEKRNPSLGEFLIASKSHYGDTFSSF